MIRSTLIFCMVVYAAKSNPESNLNFNDYCTYYDYPSESH